MNEILGNAGQITNLKHVTIDIKPGGEPNCINLGYEGLIPVAILATPIFDSAIVESSTLSLTSIVTKMKVNSGGGGSIKDVEGDGDLDLVVYFPTVVGSALQTWAWVSWTIDVTPKSPWILAKVDIYSSQ